LSSFFRDAAAATVISQVIAGGLIFLLFLLDPRLLHPGTRDFQIMAFCQLPMNLEAVGAGAFKGTGRAVQPALASIVSKLSGPSLRFSSPPPASASTPKQSTAGLSPLWIASPLRARNDECPVHFPLPFMRPVILPSSMPKNLRPGPGLIVIPFYDHNMLVKKETNFKAWFKGAW
jgi:hypothetical protein